MNWYNNLYNFANYINGASVFCGNCNGALHAIKVVRNNRNRYPIGQLLLCFCGRSKIWTNALRDEEKFMEYLENRSITYNQGICGDRFCGYCFNPMSILESSYIWKGRKWNKIGCKQCVVNQKILMDSSKEDEQPNRILSWYLGEKLQLKSLIGNIVV